MVAEDSVGGAGTGVIIIIITPTVTDLLPVERKTESLREWAVSVEGEEGEGLAAVAAVWANIGEWEGMAVEGLEDLEDSEGSKGLVLVWTAIVADIVTATVGMDTVCAEWEWAWEEAVVGSDPLTLTLKGSAGESVCSERCAWSRG